MSMLLRGIPALIWGLLLSWAQSLMGYGDWRVSWGSVNWSCLRTVAKGRGHGETTSQYTVSAQRVGSPRYHPMKWRWIAVSMNLFCIYYCLLFLFTTKRKDCWLFREGEGFHIPQIAWVLKFLLRLPLRVVYSHSGWINYVVHKI